MSRNLRIWNALTHLRPRGATVWRSGAGTSGTASERRQDPSCELWRTAAIDEVEQVVEIHAGVDRELVRERFAEACLLQHPQTPFPYVGIDAPSGGAVPIRLHGWFALPQARVLLPRHSRTRSAPVIAGAPAEAR